MVFCVKMMVGLRVDGFFCVKMMVGQMVFCVKKMVGQMVFCVKKMVGQMVFLFLRLKRGFALLRPPRGPPELVCPCGANE